MTATELKLDYFKILDVRNLAARGEVLLRGQFDRVAKPFALALLDYLASPVSKNREPCFNKAANLVWYRGVRGAVEPTRIVAIENQFGRAELQLLGTAGLLVPTELVQKGSKFPESLDHYKVYGVTGGRASERRLQIEDGFGRETVVLGMPAYFAVPVVKTHGNQGFPIRNRRTHLVIYSITPRDTKRNVVIRNQFAESLKLSAGRSEMLAAPSLKLRWRLA